MEKDLHSGNVRMPRLKACLALFLIMCLGYGSIGAMSWPGAPGAPGAQTRYPLPFGSPLGIEACRGIAGGDVRLVLNAARNKLTVNVIDNEYEAKLGRIPPKEVYELDVHNRVVQTRDAPFMPSEESRRMTSWTSGLKSQPEAFPEGYWRITDVDERDDKFGPYMVSTNARGKVDVYMKLNDPADSLYIGTYEDTGYSIHSNTNPFETSKSYGCLVMRQEDLNRLAKTLAQDRREDPKSVQTIRIRGKAHKD